MAVAHANMKPINFGRFISLLLGPVSLLPKRRVYSRPVLYVMFHTPKSWCAVREVEGIPITVQSVGVRWGAVHTVGCMAMSMSRTAQPPGVLCKIYTSPPFLAFCEHCCQSMISWLHLTRHLVTFNI